ncbi:MAG: C39 family peptidase [Sphingomonadaceae bacterium]
MRDRVGFGWPGKVCGLLLLAAGLAACVGSPPRKQHFYTGGGGFSGRYEMRIQSFAERRYLTVVRQQYDFSCGSAALATLLTYHMGIPTNEVMTFTGMWRDGDRDQIRQLGFSLLDMKRYLAAIGFNSDGYQVTLDDIDRVGVPGVALLTIKDYRHFVVVKGVTATEVLVGDPSMGLQVMRRKDFEKAWNGIYFVIDTEKQGAEVNFDTGPQWALYGRAPLNSIFLRPVDQAALMLSAPFYGEF